MSAVNVIGDQILSLSLFEPRIFLNNHNGPWTYKNFKLLLLVFTFLNREPAIVKSWQSRRSLATIITRSVTR